MSEFDLIREVIQDNSLSKIDYNSNNKDFLQNKIQCSEIFKKCMLLKNTHDKE